MPKAGLAQLGITAVRFLPTALILALLMPFAAISVNESGKALGLIPVSVSVVGTGSMYPSLFWDKADGGPEDPEKKVIEEYRTTPLMYHEFGGVTIFGRTYFHHPVGYGDMVAFKNAATAAILKQEGQDPTAGFVKRVIGLPGDTIELRDGFVYRNGTLLAEPYIAAPRSTYGGTTIEDCAPVHIPAGEYLVLGDNRKISSDSRYELGLIKGSDITFILPFNDQGEYKKLWRDVTHDIALAGTPTLNPGEFYQLVNAKRAADRVPALATSHALETAATLRASGKSSSQANALQVAGYENIVNGEFVSHGHYTAAELLANLLAFKNTAGQILNKDYSDIGVSAVDRVVNGCPTETIVGELGGYLPASYDPAVVKSWADAVTSLESTLASWQGAVGNSRVDQTKLQELLTILNRRLALAKEVLQVMDSKAWLTNDEKARIAADPEDAAAANALANSLNGQ